MATKAPGVPLDSILYYRPNTGGNVIFGVLYEIVASLLFVNLITQRDWWALCLPIGAAFQGIGFFLRLPLADNARDLGLYIPMESCIVLAPACYFAFNYLQFGRLVQRIEQHTSAASTTKRKHLTLLPPRKFGMIFILSDVTTFLIQAGGGGMQVQESLQSVGSTIFLIGIIAQFASYVFFLILVAPVVFRLGLHTKRAERGGPLDADLHSRMRAMLPGLMFSSIWIIVRSVYRTIELAQGYGSAISENEAWFFGLDSAPLLLAIGVYIFAWPSSFVELKDATQKRILPPMHDLPWAFARRCVGGNRPYAWQSTSLPTSSSGSDFEQTRLQMEDKSVVEDRYAYTA